MKKVLRLTESELFGLVRKVIKEAKRLKNQDMIDAILDKISSQGIDSLDDTERYILDNPTLFPLYLQEDSSTKFKGGIIM
jgi:hypothetical protein